MDKDRIKQLLKELSENTEFVKTLKEMLEGWEGQDDG